MELIFKASRSEKFDFLSLLRSHIKRHYMGANLLKLMESFEDIIGISISLRHHPFDATRQLKKLKVS